MLHQHLRINPFDLGSLEVEGLIPDYWNPSHVGLRLADAFLTLRRLPTEQRNMVTCWPAYCHDVNAEANEEMSLGELELMQDKRNRVHIMPTSVEITHCEAAIAWPGQYLRALRDLARAVQFAARWNDYGKIAKKRGGTADLWQSRNWLGTARIAEGLNRDGVRVF
jgi:hypothetical protein